MLGGGPVGMSEKHQVIMAVIMLGGITAIPILCVWTVSEHFVGLTEAIITTMICISLIIFYIVAFYMAYNTKEKIDEQEETIDENY